MLLFRRFLSSFKVFPLCTSNPVSFLDFFTNQKESLVTMLIKFEHFCYYLINCAYFWFHLPFCLCNHPINAYISYFGHHYICNIAHELNFYFHSGTRLSDENPVFLHQPIYPLQFNDIFVFLVCTPHKQAIFICCFMLFQYLKSFFLISADWQYFLKIMQLLART